MSLISVYSDIFAVADPGISKPGGAVPIGFVLMPLHTYPTFFSENSE